MTSQIVPAGSVSLGVVQRPEGPRARIFYRSEPGEVNDFVMGVRWDPSVPFSAAPLPPPVAFSLGFDTVSVGSGCQLPAPLGGEIDCPFPDGMMPRPRRSPRRPR